MNDFEKAILYHIAFDAGILPIEDINTDINRSLSSVSPEEARVFKRKFRKIWRKAIKKMLNDNKTSKHTRAYIQEQSGLGSKGPSRSQKRYRKSIILQEIRTVMEPMIKDFQKVKRNRSKEASAEGS